MRVHLQVFEGLILRNLLLLLPMSELQARVSVIHLCLLQLRLLTRLIRRTKLLVGSETLLFLSPPFHEILDLEVR